MIQPDWHGWMHHMFDETPEEMKTMKTNILPTTTVTHAIYNTHIGKINPTDDKETVDTSQWRQRGYKVGSLHTSEEDPDHYYKQPGHPLSDHPKGSFKERKANTEWTP
jgi:hypothetical protein